jgi:two-component system cell cycle response regulator DivK
MALVLIVEDTFDNRNICRTILEYGGHTVIEAFNGAEALALVRERRPDLIIMDVVMPVMDGLEARRRLKGDPATKEIPVLILTALARASDREEAEQAGADAFLSKPCLPKVVLAEVDRLLPA